MSDPGVNEYVARNGVTRKRAVPGSTFDQRLARSKAWRLTTVAGADGERCAPMLMSDGSMGGCDLPLGHDGAHRYTPRDGGPIPSVFLDGSGEALPPFPGSAYPPGAVELPALEARSD